MRKVYAWLGAATLFMCLVSTASAQNADVLKPYVVMILDTSGSMASATQSGPTSCGKPDSRINHATCAINNIVNSYGDMVFSLARFRETTGGSPTPSCTSSCTTVGPNCGDCLPATGEARACTVDAQCTGGDTCNTGTGRCEGPALCKFADINDNLFQLLTPLVDGNNVSTARFTDGTCNTCSVTSGTDPEIWGVNNSTFTPITATLKGEKRYWQGLQATDTSVLWPSNQLGYDPINRDQSSAVFLPKVGETTCNPKRTPNTATTPGTQCDSGSTCTGANCCCIEQCRPYINILLTDSETITGLDTCGPAANSLAAADALLSTVPRDDFYNITTITRTSGVVTATTSANHTFVVGDPVMVTGVTQVAFNNVASDPLNRTFTVTGVPAANQFTYAQPTFNNATSSGGIARHPASQYQYRIETKVIGFGVDPAGPSAAQIEAMAHAGGAADGVGNEGYYAADEAGLQVAISQILADSVRAERCNGADDDCDVAIDEDFPLKNQACQATNANGEVLVGRCAATGTYVCTTDGTGVRCNATGLSPIAEICNGIDDNCNGLIDDGINCGTCTPVAEICDTLDQDCDGVVNQTCRCNSSSTNAGAICNPNTPGICTGGGAAACTCTPITRPCGIGVCPGTETCNAQGAFAGCTASAGTEICDGLDNDCDGVCDGFDLGCSVQAGACTSDPASCPATASLGHTSKNPIPQNICRPGVRTCPLNNSCTGGNSFSACSGEVLPCGPDSANCDVCNGLDDDCDNLIDEDFVDADCSTNCGVGRTVCTNGNIVCNSTAATSDATCNNQDDDCDGKFDEDWRCPDVNPADGQCDPCGTGLVCMGIEKCIMGQVKCEGGPIGNETCNCLDDNCNNQVDEGTICPIGSECVSCQCAFRCAEGEFPCPLGKKCEGTAPNAFCVNDPCFNVSCPAVNGNLQVCQPKPGFPNEPQCVDICSLVNNTDQTDGYQSCGVGSVCVGSTGTCEFDDCRTFPDRCTAAQTCVEGTCVSNPCTGVTCDSNQYCVGGACISSCSDIECPAGQRCRMGACETDPCGEPCPFGESCNDETGQCIADPCKSGIQCPTGKWCDPNKPPGTGCVEDPCAVNAVECPNAGDVCRGGTCVDEDTLRPDAAGASHVTVGGGGGCSTTGGGSGLLLALGLLLVRRRRTVGGVK